MNARAQRGSISVLMILLLLGMAVTVAVLVQMLSAVQASAAREQAAAQALCLAESGIQVAAHHLAAGESFRGQAAQPLGKGRYTVQVRSRSPLEIVATGEAPYAGRLVLRRSVRVRGSLAGGKLVVREWAEIP